MITAVALNPSIDMTIAIPNFVYGGLNRVSEDRQDAGGKGMNVTLALRRLGAEAECVGFLQKQSAALFESKLTEHGANFDFIYCEGNTRTNIKLRDESTGEITEFNQSGKRVTEEQLQEMTALIRRHARTSSHMVLSGSTPPGCGTDYYRRLIEAASEAGCKCVLDADGERLREGIKAKPFLIKPNRYELELLTGKKAETLDQVRDAALELISQGIGVVAVSLGGEGAFITDGTQSLFAPALKIAVSSTVGAGDSMVAGLTARFAEGASLAEAFRVGVACASAACTMQGTQLFGEEVYRELYEQVEVKTI